MAKKIYAIKEGYDFSKSIKVENRIVNTWAECLKFVKGVKGAKYKSFENIEDAKKYLEDCVQGLNKADNTYPRDCLQIYVDGSYNSESIEYSYGMVVVFQDVILHIESGKRKSDNNIRQIAGELEGAIRGTEYALTNGYKKVVIFHDYVGICNHATGLWDRKEESSKAYYDKMQSFMKEGIEIVFVKVDSHTGDLFNELVDEKCKECLNIKSDKVVEKWLKNSFIKVKSIIEKQQILSLIENGAENILIVDELNNGDTKNIYTNFENIIFIYKNNKQEGLEEITKLSEKEKIDFITFLMD